MWPSIYLYSYMSIHFGTIYTFVAFTLVPCTPLSDSYRYPLHLCLIHIGTLYTFVRYTLVAFTPLSDLLRYPLHLCLIYIGTLYTFVWFTLVPFTPFVWLSTKNILNFSTILFHTKILMVLLWIGSCYSAKERSLIISYTAYSIINI